MKSTSNFTNLVQACEIAFASNDLIQLRQAIDDLDYKFPPNAGMLGTHLGILSGLLIDAGAALYLTDMVKRGLNILENNWGPLEKVYGAAQLYYNKGNAYKALYDIDRAALGWKFNLESVTSGFEAKANYWKALSAATVDKASPEHLTNLANSLDACGRVIDALHYYDSALMRNPEFGMALFNRGLALMYLNKVSESCSIKLMHEIYKCFEAAKTCHLLQSHIREDASRYAALTLRAIREHGYEVNDELHFPQENNDELQYDSYWKWCLSYSLALCEHSLYCRCSGARRDDLSIMTPSSGLGGNKVPIMELVLNRIKSEYCLSRALLYQSMNSEHSLKWDLMPFEGTFTDLLDDEEIGLTTEFLRTGFRLCFGILDRIARGICTFLDVATGNENLYFDSFWRPRGNDKSRWEKLNSLSNSHIVALYGLAKDLNERNSGEWSRLKRYRNLFEHELGLVHSDSADSEKRYIPPWLNVENIFSISRKELSADALDMLRFTRAAIFHFVFLVRTESKFIEGNGAAHSVTFEKKNIGKD